MSETHLPYLTEPDRDRIQSEAWGLAYVMSLETGDRAEACAKLEGAAYALRPWIVAVRREVDKTPAAGLPSMWAVLDRPGMDRDREAVDAAGVNLASLQGLDPAKANRAYEAALADTKRAGMLARVRSARLLLDGVEGAGTDTGRRDAVADAVHELTRAEAEGDAPLADTWTAHLENMGAEAGPDDVLRLDPRRGTWAGWVNDCLGSRGGLEPGQTFILGGAPEAGKTSLAAVLAVDALAVGVPVLFWQLELSREETLEHLQGNRPDLAGWPTGDFWGRARVGLPDAWGDLLTVPRWPAPKAEAVRDALLAQARRARKLPHKVKGLVLVDYAQLLTVRDKATGDSRFEVLEKAASRLAKAAAENGACLVILSQLNKAEQRDGQAEGTALAGADLARMAHRVALLQKADRDGAACKGGVPVDWKPDKGEARLLTWTKRRGMKYTDGRRPDREGPLWYHSKGRALHGGDVAEVDEYL